MKKLLPTLALGAVAVAVSQMAFAGSWTTETIAQMPVSIYTPSSAPVLNGKRALMISTGGCTQQGATNTEFRDQSNWEATAEEYGMVVAVPNAPNGGVLIFGCWDYYDSNHTRTNRHNDNILSLVSTLKSRSALNIDSDQVYFSGLSSGGGMVNVMACLAPDVFAGLGNSAGPAVGTSSSEVSFVATTAQEMRNTCLSLAGSNSSFLDTQIMSIVWGSSDFIAAPGYADVNANGFASVYGATADSGSEVIPGISLDGVETTHSDANGERVSKVIVQGLAHAWPAGGGSGVSTYMDNTSINYPAHLTAFLFANNRRVGREPPVGVNSLTLNSPSQVELGACDLYDEPGFSATDATLGDVTNLVAVSGNQFDTCTAGTYTISYSVDFSDGSQDTQTRTVVVSSQPTFDCQEFVSSNYDHLVAGRAAYCNSGALVCTVGSGEQLGYAVAWPNNVVVSEPSPGYFQAGSCQ